MTLVQSLTPPLAQRVQFCRVAGIVPTYGTHTSVSSLNTWFLSLQAWGPEPLEEASIDPAEVKGMGHVVVGGADIQPRRGLLPKVEM